MFHSLLPHNQRSTYRFRWDGGYFVLSQPGIFRMMLVASNHRQNFVRRAMHTSQSVLKWRLALFLVIIHFLLSVEGRPFLNFFGKASSRKLEESFKLGDSTADPHSALPFDTPISSQAPLHPSNSIDIQAVHPASKETSPLGGNDEKWVHAYTWSNERPPLIPPNTPLHIITPQERVGRLRYGKAPEGAYHVRTAYRLPLPSETKIKPQDTTKDQSEKKVSSRTKQQDPQSTNVLEVVDSNEIHPDGFTFPVWREDGENRPYWEYKPFNEKKKDDLDALETRDIHNGISSSGVHTLV